MNLTTSTDLTSSRSTRQDLPQAIREIHLCFWSGEEAEENVYTKGEEENSSALQKTFLSSSSSQSKETL